MSDKQQQILQMAKDICRVKLNCNDVCNPVSACDALKYAERAYEEGYRKQSDTADVVPRAEVEKIFEEIAFVMKEYADRDIDEPELYARIGTIHKRFTKGENAQKDYFTPEEVRKMSQTEVRKNYQAIMKSMKKW